MRQIIRDTGQGTGVHSTVFCATEEKLRQKSRNECTLCSPQLDAAGVQ
jgi:hypothetical protein